MESYLNQNFDVKAKHSSEEVLEKWRNLCGVVKNPKRRFRFTANLSKRYEAAAMRKTNQVLLLVFFQIMVWNGCALLVYFLYEYTHMRDFFFLGVNVNNAMRDFVPLLNSMLLETLKHRTQPQRD